MIDAQHLAVDARQLVKTYRNGAEAVRGVSLQIPAGTVFGLLGPRGAGKSTLIRMLTTLCAPTSGGASVAGHDIVREQDRVRRSIGCVTQQSGVDVHATGQGNLDLKGRAYGLHGRELAARKAVLLDRFALTGVSQHPVGTYCDGMRRKLDIAMALIHDPRVLFLDEPTAGLDPGAGAEIWDQIRELAWDEGLTILLATRSVQEVGRLARRIAVIDRGLIVAEGSAEELKAELAGGAITSRLVP